MLNIDVDAGGIKVTNNNEEQREQKMQKMQTEKKKEKEAYSFAADFAAASDGDKLAEARGRYLDESLTTLAGVMVGASIGTVAGAVGGVVLAKKAEMSNEETLNAAALGSVLGGNAGVVVGYMGMKAYNAFTR